ncbi:type II secretion system protein [Lentisphaera marina]|uniref:type II secretion system protein n=1 Tax=Lentisphaera marina TaxID=1111041 RepID=UPI00236640EF|nr:type II secretion system protein [Lentisphaera marina]MDD7985316.1 type II secretion system protein [Lentisphaera marina]
MRLERQRFTLIELLIVIAIIGILASLLAPTLKNARGKSKSAVCKSNLKQWGMFTAIYTDDTDGFLPYRVFGVWTINKYIPSSIGEHKFCPSDELAQDKNKRLGQGGSIRTSYGYNGSLAKDNSLAGDTLKKITDIEIPNHTLLFIDRGHNGENDGYPGGGNFSGEKADFVWVHKHKAYARHEQEYANMVQLDGSVNRGKAIYYRTPSGWNNSYRHWHFQINKYSAYAAQALAEIQ